MRLKKIICVVIFSLLTLSSFAQVGIMEAHATLNPTWVVPANDVKLSDVQTFLDYVEWWLYQSLTNGNTSGSWRPALFYNNRTLAWTMEDLEFSGWFYDFYALEAYLSTGDPKYLQWLKGFADYHLNDPDLYYCDTHESSSQISALIAAYDLCYGRNNDALKNRIQILINHLIAERYNPTTGLWKVDKTTKNEYVWKMFFALRAISQWYQITKDPSLKAVMEKGLNYAITHQDVYGGKQWYPFIDWSTGNKLGSGDFAEYHETQQGLDGLLYAADALNNSDFKACFEKYLGWWCDKGIDSDGGIYGWYDKNQNGLYNTYNGLVGELIYFLVRGYFWIGNSTYITSACKLFHKMTKWMTYTPETAAYGYNCSYVLHYDLSTDNPSAFTIESDYGRQVDGFCAAVAYNGFNYLMKALPGYEPPKFSDLQVNSTPIVGISFNLNGTTQTTPYSASLSQDNWTVVMPATFNSGGLIYSFSHWEDGSTSTTRTINLTSETSITATYEPPPMHILSVDSVPIAGVLFTLDGTSHATNYSTTLFEGTHTVVMPSFVSVGGINYRFAAWEDGPTGITRAINLNADTSITAIYEVSPTPPPGTILFSLGFENGNFNEWDVARYSTGASLSVVVEQAHHGTYSSKATAPDAGAGAFCRKKLASGQTTLSTRFYVRFANLPTGVGQRCCLLKYLDANYNDIVWLILYHNGANVLLQIVNFYPVVTTSYVWNPSINMWYSLELTFVKGVSGGASAYVNGVEVAAWTGDTRAAGNMMIVQVGAHEMNGYTQTLYDDCVTIADGYIGPET